MVWPRSRYSKSVSKISQFARFPYLERRFTLCRCPQGFDCLIRVVMVSGCAHHISEQHHPHGHTVGSNTTYSSLIFQCVSTTRSIGTKVTPNSSHAERTPLIRVPPKTLGLISIPNVVHTVSFDPLINSTNRFVVGNPVSFHSNQPFFKYDENYIKLPIGTTE